MKRILFAAAITLGLPGCGSLPTVTAATTAAAATVSKAQTDLQDAINAYGVAKGIAQVATLVQPEIGPAVSAATAIGDPVVAQAQTILNAGTSDANAIEALVTTIESQAQTLTLAGAPSVTVIPNVPAS
jgi:uncharacterized protein YceK